MRLSLRASVHYRTGPRGSVEGSNSLRHPQGAQPDQHERRPPDRGALSRPIKLCAAASDEFQRL
jgi:hypothetical protein